MLSSTLRPQEFKSHVLKFWHPGPKGLKMGAKNVGVVCNSYNELAFLCNETHWYEIPTKTSTGVL